MPSAGTFRSWPLLPQGLCTGRPLPGSCRLASPDPPRSSASHPSFLFFHCFIPPPPLPQAPGEQSCSAEGSSRLCGGKGSPPSLPSGSSLNPRCTHGAGQVPSRSGSAQLGTAMAITSFLLSALRVLWGWGGLLAAAWASDLALVSWFFPSLSSSPFLQGSHPSAVLPSTVFYLGPSLRLGWGLFC